MFEILSTVLKYIFVTFIYLFIYSIIRLIYLDIRSIDSQSKNNGKHTPYLKLINRREELAFKVQENYALDGVMLLGRTGKNDIAIADPYMSGNHARFSLKNGGYCIEDMGSTNGTFVNSEPVKGEALQLKDGDRIHAGQLDFLFVEAK